MRLTPIVKNVVLYDGPSHSDEGDSFNITCIAPVFESIKWSLNGNEAISNDPNVEIRTHDTDPGYGGNHIVSTLRVVSARGNYTGDYKCVSVSDDTRSFSHFVISGKRTWLDILSSLNIFRAFFQPDPLRQSQRSLPNLAVFPT